jgi:hypothetical protein
MIHYSPPLNRPHLLLQWKRGLVKRVGFPEGEYLVVFYSIRGLAIGEMGSIKGVAFGGRGLIRGVIFGGVGPLKRGHYCTHYRPCSDFLYYNLTTPPHIKRATLIWPLGTHRATIGLSLENPNHYSAVLLVEEIRIHREKPYTGTDKLIT